MSWGPANELSGIAASQKNPGVLWTHNDSGDTERIFATNTSGKLLGTYVKSSNKAVDWEDIAVGPGPTTGTKYVYIGSIGGNGGRHSLVAYRVAEPSVSLSQSAGNRSLSGVVALKMHYPGTENHNAEAMLVDPMNHDIYIFTKTSEGVSRVYRYPGSAQNASIDYALQFVTQLQFPAAVTAGDFAPNGTQFIIKGYSWSILFQRPSGSSMTQALAGTRCNTPLGPGEALGFAADNSGYYTVQEGDSPPLLWFKRN
jgi:hypothetical protein